MFRFHILGVVEYVLKVENAFDKKVAIFTISRIHILLFRILNKSRLFVLKKVDEHV